MNNDKAEKSTITLTPENTQLFSILQRQQRLDRVLLNEDVARRFDEFLDAAEQGHARSFDTKEGHILPSPGCIGGTAPFPELITGLRAEMSDADGLHCAHDLLHGATRARMALRLDSESTDDFDRASALESNIILGIIVEKLFPPELMQKLKTVERAYSSEVMNHNWSSSKSLEEADAAAVRHLHNMVAQVHNALVGFDTQLSAIFLQN